MLGENSGLAGIAYWINTNYNLEGDGQIDKNNPVVAELKGWIDGQYAAGRQTSITTAELEEKIEVISGGSLRKL